MPVSLGIDAEGLRTLAKDLRTAKAAESRILRDALKAGAEIVAVDARSRASWSSRIPSTIKANGSTAGRAWVTAGGPGAPHATFWEATTGSGHRHPVFGRRDRSGWTWTDKPGPRPFMVPALQAKADQVADFFADAIVSVFAEGGFRF